MGQAHFLGVDGGGTKTRFVLIDDAGQVLALASLGSSYHPQVGLEQVRDVLAAGVAEVLAAARLPAAAITHAFFGLPAYGEDSAATAALDDMPAPLLGHRRYACDNDMVCGWAGSLGCADGINIVAGTGSIGYGQREGRAARAGGWGEVFSDEGSAHWIAVQGLNAYSRMSDGRLARGPLYALVNDAFGLGNDLDLCAHIYGSNALTRDQLARHSQLVGEAARSGDDVALGIYHRAGQELADIADALRNRLGFAATDAVRVSWSGGAFGASELLLGPFRAALQAKSPRFELRAPLHEPHIGAALYAQHLAQRHDGAPAR